MKAKSEFVCSDLQILSTSMIDPSLSEVDEIIRSLENFFRSLCASLMPEQVLVEKPCLFK